MCVLCAGEVFWGEIHVSVCGGLQRCGRRVFCQAGRGFCNRSVFLCVQDFYVVVDVCFVCGGGGFVVDVCVPVCRGLLTCFL